MIKLCKDSNNFLDICDKLQEVKGARLTQNILYNYMVSGLYGKQVFTFVSYDKDKMNGCITLFLAQDILGELTLNLLFVWIDVHYPKILKKFINITEMKAKDLKVKRISFITNRKEKLINRKMGKYGFKKTCSIYEKEINV